MSEQQMNKLCGKTHFPDGTVAMKTLASTNNFILARTVKLEVRSIDRLKNEHGRHSQRKKNMLQTHYIERPALLSQHSRDAKYTIDKIILPLDQGRWITVEMKSSAPGLSNDIPVGHQSTSAAIRASTSGFLCALNSTLGLP